MSFCLKAEEFVDDKLSNWYVRRNRRRFWKSEKGLDKLAAYQTLHAVLVALVKLCAPIIPFMSEKMYRNLTGDTGSVHLCDYPKPATQPATPGVAGVGVTAHGVSASTVDRELCDEMDALLRIVSLGGSARNAVKIKTRQPLSEIKIQPASDIERKAIERFADQIREELNIKKVTLHDGKSPLLTFDVKLNPKAAGPRFGNQLGAVQQALTTVMAERGDLIVAALQGGVLVELPIPNATLTSADVWITPKVEKGWGGIADRGTQILLDGRLTLELELEGVAREIVRHVQNARKDAELEMDDRIVLVLQTDDPKLKEAIRVHRDYIANETLVVNWATDALGGIAHRVEVKIEGATLIIELKKAT
jgi:isoleucyl-tRNA synthetase